MSNNELPFAENYGIAKFIYATIKNALYDSLFDLNLEKAIYISNESEADSLARTLTINCCNVLDRSNRINWNVDSKKTMDEKNDAWMKFMSEVS